MNYKIGSMWRKWDLHVHSPFSVLYHGDLGNGFDEENKASIMDKYIYELFTRAVKENIFVIGITDYFMIEGYKEVKKITSDTNRMSKIFSNEIRQDSNYIDKINKILILPNIEFRLGLAISEKTKKGLKNSKYQIHVIFSESIDIQKIEHNFLHRLEFVKDFGEGLQDKYTLTKENFINYGNKLISSTLGGEGSPLFVGMNNAYVDISKLVELLNTPEFKNNHIIVLAEEDQSNQNWNDQLSGIRSNLYNASNAIFSTNSKTIKWGIDGTSYNILNKNMPCIWGSDAHEFQKMFKPDLERHTWIKADTSFNGLILALKNPENRIFIGKKAKELEEAISRKNVTIKEVNVKLKDSTKQSKVWFDTEMILNPFLVTIIGNKGSGKSALSDIIGYLGNTHNSNYFSFLSNERFLSKKTKYGEMYNSKLTFWSGKEIIKEEVSNNTDISNSEDVKYLPQKFIEEICNDLEDSFQNEINEAIFSYVSPQEKGTSTNLEDLIRSKIKNNLNNLIALRSDLEKINNEIRRLEEKSVTIYKREMLNKVTGLKNKLKDHIESKPEEVNKPSDDLKNEYSEIISNLSEQVASIEKDIAEKVKTLTYVNQLVVEVEYFKEEVSKVISDISDLNSKYQKLTSMINIENKEYIKIVINNKEMDSRYQDLINEKIELNMLLDDTNIILGTNLIPDKKLNVEEITSYVSEFVSLYDKKEILELFIKRFSKDVTYEEQKYLEYQSQLKIWNNAMLMIKGDIPNTIDGETIKKYEEELDYVNTQLSADLTAYYESRLECLLEIYNEYVKIIDKYVAIYAPIQDKINVIMQSEIEKIEFKALLKVNKETLKEKILSYIDTRVGGDFKGKSEANKEVDNIISSTDFNNLDSVKDFVITLLNKVAKDPNETQKILSNPLEFYNFLTKLEYLNPVFSIISGDRDLSELSPGERGIVLLIFYLALSKDNIPLIIDQPEDNLDNQSVFTRLVPAIIEAKKNRQVIVVTHNPNIAIACDSEEVIFCSIDKTTGKICYDSGSIENPIINKHILDVLEGTKPAFDKRKKTYN